MTIIALAGYAGVGKDAVADHLVQHHQFTRFAFADPLKSVLYDLNPQVEVDTDAMYALGIGDRLVNLQPLVDTYGWEFAKKVVEVRQLLQRLGVAVRDNIYQDAWVDALFGRADEYPRVVISDCRFKNEAKAVKDQGGFVVRVERPGIFAANEHVSEHDLDNWFADDIVINDGDLDDLGKDIERAMERLGIL